MKSRKIDETKVYQLKILLERTVLYQLKILLGRISIIVLFIMISFLIASEQQQWIEVMIWSALIIEVFRFMYFEFKNREDDEKVVKEGITRVVQNIGLLATVVAMKILFESMFELNENNWTTYFLVATVVIIAFSYVIDMGLAKVDRTIEQNQQAQAEMQALEEKEVRMKRLLWKHQIQSFDEKGTAYVSIKDERHLIATLRTMNISLDAAVAEHEEVCKSILLPEYEIDRNPKWSLFPAYKDKVEQ